MRIKAPVGGRAGFCEHDAGLAGNASSNPAPMSRLVTSAPHGRAAAAVLAAQFVLMWSAFFVLSAALDWPASLDLPAAEKLALFGAHVPAGLLGYGLYAASALLLIPAAVALRRTLLPASLLGDLSAVLGASAGVVKAVALSRWLLLAPALAAGLAGGTPAARATTVAVFDAVDTLGGGVGEVVGIGILSAGWTVALAAGLWRSERLGGRALGAAGLVSAALLALSVPAGFGLDLGPVLTVGGIGWQLWLAALAVWLVRGRAEAPAVDPRAARPTRRAGALVAAALVGVLSVPAATAQTAPGRSTVAEVGTGFGKSDFYGRLEDAEIARDDAGFGPNLGGTLSLAVYQRAGWATDRLWLGGRFKVHISLPSTTSQSTEEYFFNHYYGGPSARYYLLSEQRTGPFVQADLTYGQFTAKLRDESIDRADHQFAVGPGVLGAVGYAVPVGGERRANVSFYVQRNTGSGDVPGEGSASFGYGSLGAEIVLGF